MLMNCPECEAKISDRAISCPHCGYPVKPAQPTQPTVKRSAKKRMRLPNGFGQISEIKNRNLRKPFRAMVSIGINESGRAICKPLTPESYFKTYNEAYKALVKYHENPYDVGDSTTLIELYEKWLPEYQKDKAAPTVQNMKSAWKHLSSIESMKISEIRVRHIKGCIDEADVSPNVAKRMKQLLNVLFDYAILYELTDKNYARMYSLSSTINNEAKKVSHPHITYSEEEMNALWESLSEYPIVDTILIQCYSGWRPGELMQMKVKDVDLELGFYIGGMKTEAGMNRKVPIHSKVFFLVQQRCEAANALGSEYVFCNEKGKRMTYDAYRDLFDTAKEALGLNSEHRPHDGRVRFVTQAKASGVDEYAIKYIVGHSIQDITESTYTKRELSWLKSEIEKIR